MKLQNDEDFLEDVTFYHFDQEKNLEEIIISEKVTVSDEGWKFTNPKNIKNNSNLTTYIWEEGPEYGFKEKLGRKEMSLSQIYKILGDAGPKREKNLISYEFWKKLFQLLLQQVMKYLKYTKIILLFHTRMMVLQ